MVTFCEESYLNRIHLASRPSLNSIGLKEIHNAQHRAIPFENFDVALGQPIEVTHDALVKKLVNLKRGGYCFELNGILLIALKHFGFKARALLAKVHLSGESTGRGHLLILVELAGEKWIVDAGFGSQTPRAPMLFQLNKEISIDHQKFKLTEDDLYGVMLQAKAEEEWKNLYSFDLCHVCQGDIDYGNYFTSTHPSSVFVSSCVAYIPTETGGVSLLNRTLKKVSEGSEIAFELDNSNYIGSLKKHFGIELKDQVLMLKHLN